MNDTDQDMIFIVPRGENMLLLGGLTEEDEWSLDIGLHNHQPYARDITSSRQTMLRCGACVRR